MRKLTEELVVSHTWTSVWRMVKRLQYFPVENEEKIIELKHKKHSENADTSMSVTFDLVV